MDEKDEVDLTLLPDVIGKYIQQGRSGLLPALQAAQKIYGWLPSPVTAAIGRALQVPLSDVHGVVEFYSLLYNKPVPKKIFRVCTDPACAMQGADNIYSQLSTLNKISPVEISVDEHALVEQSPCLGLCEHAPAVMLNDDVVTGLNINSGNYNLSFPESRVHGSLRWLTKNCGSGRPTQLREYGAYTGFRHALEISPETVIAEIKAAGLVGRGGAAFPTAAKWEGARNAPGSQKYVVCNADESEPGTFKDRILLADDSHLIIEGLCIAAYAIGATRGFIYLRGEYPYLLPILEEALVEARNAGYLNQNFDIEIRLGAGAYICGEETALFESIEGKRGFPRVKPPFPTTNGLFDAPTVINNVETLCNVPLILEKGATEYRRIGTEKSPGTKLFCVSGDVPNPGLYEVAFGVTFRELLEMAGNDLQKDSIQAVLFGGAAGAFATPAQFDVKLSFEDLRAAGLPLGSGVIMVFDKTRDLRDTLKRLGHFFAHESCGKCYPCQLGTQRQKEILDRISVGNILIGDTERLQDVGWTMTDASLCGLGQTAASAVLSAIKQFPHLFVENRIRIKEDKVYL